ncbi:hypothetical protein JMJ77_0008388 [Colletotrichum scovillei]|uniref:Uncharacterized protein n=1 Tax=Colletotrichum scovillei TaxID=1209932 RepID=A0A9P7RE38_9PEZI|nr:hypothetical protein JMJ77_0008388 [Colletotrichum scovillei]KAG7075380.1 hypothetical protein JMJ76_0011840 [Colletotrichum scovillei]KAG7082271.1 hypothetical protein JMJ78_0004374 [Colletotrichum scovillei]
MDASNAAYLFEQLSEEDKRHLASLSKADIRKLALLATIRLFSRGISVMPTPIEAQPIPGTDVAVPSDNLDTQDHPEQGNFCNDSTCPCNSINSPGVPSDPADRSAPQEALHGFIFGGNPMFRTDHQLCADHARMCRSEYWSESEESSNSGESLEDDSETEELEEPVRISVDDYIYLDEDGNELDSEGPGLSDLRYDFEGMVCSTEGNENKG